MLDQYKKGSKSLENINESHLQADQEQVFHTKDKNGLIIHPTSCFSYKPKPLEPTGKQEPDPLQPQLKRLVSHRHQLLGNVKHSYPNGGFSVKNFH